MTHPIVEAEYQKVKLAVPDNAPDIVEKEFFQQTQPNTRKVAINRIIRVLRGDKEYVLYKQTMMGQTLEGNRRYLNRTMGRYQFPYFAMTYDEKTGRPEPNGRIDRFEEKYEFEYSPSTVKKIFAKDQMNTNTGMSINLGSVSYSVTNKDDFINMPANKLISKITGQSIEAISAPSPSFVTSSSDAPERTVLNTQMEQEAARRRMYDFNAGAESHASFGPTPNTLKEAHEQTERESARIAEQSTSTSSSSGGGGVPVEQQQQQPDNSTSVVTSTTSGKAAQSRATNRIGENVGVVLKNEDTGAKQNITKDSITIEQPQGSLANKGQQQQQEKKKMMMTTDDDKETEEEDQQDSDRRQRRRREE